jgi:hypothetical protein
MFNDPSRLAVDHRAPLAALLEAEEEDMPDALDLAGICGIPRARARTSTKIPQAAMFTPKGREPFGIEEAKKSGSSRRHLFEHFLREVLAVARHSSKCCLI